MNDKFLKKISGFSNAYDKFESISGLSKSSLVAMDGVSIAMNKNLSKIYENSHIYTFQDVLLSNDFFEPTKINPLMDSIANISKLLDSASLIHPNVSMNDWIDNVSKSVSNSTKFEYINISNITKTLFENFDFSSINWRESYPNFSFEDFSIKSSEFTKFYNKITSIPTDYNLNDGIVASLNLDSENFDDLSPEANEIFNIANETIEKISSTTSSNEVVFDVYNWFLEKISVYINKNNISIVVLAVVSNLISKYFENNCESLKDDEIKYKIEEVISVKNIPVKLKPIGTYKDFYQIPIGSEIEIIKRFKVWAKIVFINSEGINQVGYCRIEDLKE